MVKAVIYLSGFWLIQRFRGVPVDLIALAIAFFVLIGFSLILAHFQSRQPPALNTVVPLTNTGIEGERTLGQTGLEIRFNDAWPIYRIGVYNSGTHVARTVEVWLDQVHGNSYYQVKELPHRLKTKDDKEKRCDINPDREEQFDFAATGGGSPDKGTEFQILGLRLNPLQNRRADSEHMVLRLHDYLHLYVKVYCANAEPQTAIFYAYPMEPTVGVGIHVGRIYQRVMDPARVS